MNTKTKEDVLEEFYLLTKDHNPEVLARGDYLAKFKESLELNRTKTLLVLLWSGDTKYGLCTETCINNVNPEIASTKVINTSLKYKYINALIMLNRWAQVVDLLNHNLTAKVRIYIFNEIARALKNKNINCAKCVPRNGRTATRLRGYMKLTPVNWRKLLVPICCNQITVLMSSNKWSEIDYESLPTHILVKYNSAFKRHDKERYEEYLRVNTARSVVINRILNKQLRVKPPLSLDSVLNLQYFKTFKHRR